MTGPTNRWVIPAPSVDAPAPWAEKAGIRSRLEQYAIDEVLGNRTPGQVSAATRAGTARIRGIDELLHVNLVDDPLAEVINSSDPVALVRDLGLADQRVLIDRTVTVTILSSGRRGRGVDRATVDVTAKHHRGAGCHAACGGVTHRPSRTYGPQPRRGQEAQRRLIGLARRIDVLCAMLRSKTRTDSSPPRQV